MAITAPHPPTDSAAAGQESGVGPPARPTPRPDARRTHNLLPVAFATILLAIAAWMLADQLSTPSPRPASAPANVFSADRAMGTVQTLASETRYIGSPGHTAAQRYLIAQLRDLGIRPRTQHTVSINRFPGGEFDAGTVTNIIARLPGTASTGAVLLNAHYDSGATGPAASDCASCVATVLETLRALQAGPPLRNDLIVVFSDAEENGDLGAAAFAEQHPWMRDVKAAINFETAGSHGPSMLIATNSSWMVDQTLASASSTRTYSLLPSLIRGLLKGGQLATDTQEYMNAGAAGAQFVYMNGSTDYHTLPDNVAHLGRGSLQQDGDYALALTRRLGNMTLLRHIGDSSAYFNLTSGIIVKYGPAFALLVALAGVALFAASLAVGFRRHLLTVRGLIGAGLAFPTVALIATIASGLAWPALKSAVPNLDVYTIGSNQNLSITFGLCAIALTVFLALYVPLRRRTTIDNLSMGALAWWLVLTVGFTLAAPGASYFFAWPTIAALSIQLWRLQAERRAPGRPRAGSRCHWPSPPS